MAFKLPSTMYQNAGIAGAANALSSAMFDNTDKTGLDPSAIFENEQQALAAKALAAKRQKETSQIAQSMGFWDKTSQMPGFNAGWQNSNADQIANSESERLYQGMIKPHLTPEILAGDPNKWSEATWRLVQSMGGERDPLKFDQAASPTLGQTMFDTDQQRLLDQNTAKMTQLSEANAADNIRALATNKADNIRATDVSSAKVLADNKRAIQVAEIGADSDLLRTILTLPAGSTNIFPADQIESVLPGLNDPTAKLPPGWQRLGDGNYQYTAPDAKAAAKTSESTYIWGPFDDSQVEIVKNKELDRLAGFRDDLGDLDGVPTELWAGLSRIIQKKKSVTDKGVLGGKFFKHSDKATKAMIFRLLKPGLDGTALTQIDVSWMPWGEFYMPTSMIDSLQGLLNTASRDGRLDDAKDQMLDDLTNSIDGWGLTPDQGQAIMEWLSTRIR